MSGNSPVMRAPALDGPSDLQDYLNYSSIFCLICYIYVVKNITSFVYATEHFTLIRKDEMWAYDMCIRLSILTK